MVEVHAHIAGVNGLERLLGDGGEHLAGADQVSRVLGVQLHVDQFAHLADARHLLGLGDGEVVVLLLGLGDRGLDVVLDEADLVDVEVGEAFEFVEVVDDHWAEFV